jgi:hypothetical protein
MRLAAALTAALALAAPPASALEVSGVKVPDTLTVGGTSLVLNGAGLRTKTMFKVKVYVAALYLPAKASDAAAILAADGPRAVRLVLMRNLDRSQLVDSIKDGFDAGGKGRAAQFEAQIKAMEAPIPAELKEGQVVLVTYVPGEGSSVALEGGKGALVPGKDFADALFGVWLGSKVADGGLEDLREALLGK